MTTQQNQNRRETAIDAKMVEDFLREHPDYFTTRSALLAELTIPHVAGKAVSLIERQVDVLREQNHRYRKQLQELIQIARDNDRLVDHLQNLTLGLIDVDDVDQKLILLQNSLQHDLNVDAATLCIYPAWRGIVPEDHPREFLEIADVEGDGPLAGISKSLRNGDPVCGRLRPDQLALLFPAHAALVRSAALVPLAASPPFAPEVQLGAILAIGSRRGDRFYAEMGTMFLKYLGHLMSRVLHPVATADTTS